jgi:hypothetical protein
VAKHSEDYYGKIREEFEKRFEEHEKLKEIGEEKKKR